MTMTVFDDRQCHLGEGPLWHPERGQLFWFDIIGKTLHTRENDAPRSWTFDWIVSAAGWSDRDHLLIATEQSLVRFNIETGDHSEVAPLEADSSGTRCNDGRADPFGGFWIGTMGKSAEKEAGAIYRYYRGEVRKLFPNISIPNAICFSPDGRTAYFADTAVSKVWRIGLGQADGWPEGDPEVFLDLDADGLNPDGAVIDADGVMWQAQWGAARVAAYRPDGSFVRAIDVPAPHSSCPAFGGDDLTTLFCTTARQGMDEDALAAQPESGMTFTAGPGVAKGQAEHRVII